MVDDSLPGDSGAPLVSELYDRLARDLPAHARNRSALFQVALQVCTEELRLTKRGAPSASMDILVERAKLILTGAVRPPADLQPLPLGEMPHLFSDPLNTPFDSAGALLPHPVSDGPFGDDVRVSPGPAQPTMTFEEILARQEQLEAEDLAARRATRRRPSPMLIGALVAITVLAVAAGMLFLSPQRTRTANVDQDGDGATPVETPTAVPPGSIRVVPTLVPLEPTAPPQPTATPQPEPARPPAATVATTVATIRRPTRRPAPAPTTQPSDLPEPVPARPPAPRRVPVMTSIDWRGKDPTYVIHFSSYRDQAPAAADARRLAAQHSRPAFAVFVDLGPEGRWWRVILAGFADVEAAVAYRDELIALHTPELGHVFRIETSK